MGARLSRRLYIFPWFGAYGGTPNLYPIMALDLATYTTIQIYSDNALLWSLGATHLVRCLSYRDASHKQMLDPGTVGAST